MNSDISLSTLANRQRRLLLTIAISGFLAVVIGAFGAHWLKKYSTPDKMHAFETGVQFQFYHTIAALVCFGLSVTLKQKRPFIISATYFLIGVVLFSGSLYAITITDALGYSIARYIGMVTPLGGIAFILGWFRLTQALFIRKEVDKDPPSSQ